MVHGLTNVQPDVDGSDPYEVSFIFRKICSKNLKANHLFSHLVAQKIR